jgi:hypothetical protein
MREGGRMATGAVVVVVVGRLDLVNHDSQLLCRNY